MDQLDDFFRMVHHYLIKLFGLYFYLFCQYFELSGNSCLRLVLDPTVLGVSKIAKFFKWASPLENEVVKNQEFKQFRRFTKCSLKLRNIG